MYARTGTHIPPPHIRTRQLVFESATFVCNDIPGQKDYAPFFRGNLFEISVRSAQKNITERRRVFCFWLNALRATGLSNKPTPHQLLNAHPPPQCHIRTATCFCICNVRMHRYPWAKGLRSIFSGRLFRNSVRSASKNNTERFYVFG